MNLAHTVSVSGDLNADEISRMFGLNRQCVAILNSRGYDTPEKIDAFLNPRVSDLHSPFLMNGVREAVSRIRNAIESNERIGIFADSDLDGITSLAVFYNLFARMKAVPVIRYLKDDENYGLTREMIDEFRDSAVSLLITVDSGIRDRDEIAYARSLGIDVIVTDHHEQDSSLPDAIIVNPKVATCSYPFKHLSGVGIAFKICHALLLSYLPSYDRLFLIVYQDGDEFSLAHVRNCIVEKMEKISGRETMQDIIDSIPDDGMALCLTNDDSTPALIHSRNSKKVQVFAQFISMIVGSKCGTIDSLRGLLNLRGASVNGGIGLSVKIFLEAVLGGSEKINDFIDSALGLVALGTIADVVPLIGENRILVRKGIDTLNQSRQAALNLLAINEKISARSIGWGIAPLLNTPGRLGRTELTVNFFIENDITTLRKIISEIKVLNEDRKNTVNSLCERFVSEIGSGIIDSAGAMIYIKTDQIPDGYAGLIANRISDMIGKPVVVVVLPGKNGIVKGSGRTKSSINYFSHIEKFGDRFERIGGHEKAFGFTVRADAVDDIMKDLEESMKHDASVPQAMPIDCAIDPADIDADFVRQFEIFEPCGSGNPEPVFSAGGLLFDSFSVFGKNHGKYLMRENRSISVIGWGMSRVMEEHHLSGKPLDITFRLENNRFNGQTSPRLILIDVSYAENRG